jgi:hypothetical protein
MTDNPQKPPSGDTPPVPAAPAKTPAPKKGFDPASIRGGKQPGGKVMRGAGKLTLPGKWGGGR